MNPVIIETARILGGQVVQYSLAHEPVKQTGVQPRQRRRPSTDALALTPAQTCRALGIDKKTLGALVADRTIRTVPWRGVVSGATTGRRWRVPRSEVERLAADGIPQPGERPPRRRGAPRKPRSADEVAAAIGRLPID